VEDEAGEVGGGRAAVEAEAQERAGGGCRRLGAGGILRADPARRELGVADHDAHARHLHRGVPDERSAGRIAPHREGHQRAGGGQPQARAEHAGGQGAGAAGRPVGEGAVAGVWQPIASGHAVDPPSMLRAADTKQGH